MTTPIKEITMKRWILFTSYGWLIGILLIVILAIISESVFKMQEESGGQAIVGIGMGAGVGIMQWLAIRKYLPSSQGFFYYTLIGFSSAFILMDIFSAIIDIQKIIIPLKEEFIIPITVIVGAIISGWLHYYFVFKKIMNKAKIWIIYFITGWLIATLITVNISFLNIKFTGYLPRVLAAFIAFGGLSIGGVILGYITGLFIVPKIKNEFSIRDFEKNS